jgi:hypothetical protein
MRSLDFFNLPNPFSRTIALGWTQPLTEMSTRNLPGGKGRLPSMSGLDGSQPYGNPRPVTLIALLSLLGWKLLHTQSRETSTRVENSTKTIFFSWTRCALRGTSAKATSRGIGTCSDYKGIWPLFLQQVLHNNEPWLVWADNESGLVLLRNINGCFNVLCGFNNSATDRNSYSDPKLYVSRNVGTENVVTLTFLMKC